MPSSHSQTATRVASHPSPAEPSEVVVQDVRSQGSPGLVRRALRKLLGSAESLVRGPLSAAGSDLAIHPEAPPLTTPEPSGDTRRLSLALQGGGAFGAFTWGVLDRLLEEDDLELDVVSGTSAGGHQCGPARLRPSQRWAGRVPIQLMGRMGR